jgi:glycosyltransferase involved in cell wall biosynthesis
MLIVIIAVKDHHRMDICHVAHGAMTIPPLGWGAVESVIWNYKRVIESLGHRFHIINTRDPIQIVRQVRALKPHVIHVHCELWVELLRHCDASVKIISTHDGNFFDRDPQAQRARRVLYGKFVGVDCYVHCLSQRIRDYFLRIGVEPERLFVLRNGAHAEAFKFCEKPRYPERSIFLGRIDTRKRQLLAADFGFVDFVGPASDRRFDYSSANYLGEWSKQRLHAELTDYAGLVLLSQSEAAPLVTCEALVAGLGVVVSENAAANLDRDQPFVHVVPEQRIEDRAYLRDAILENQRVAATMRRRIREYGVAKFDWDGIVRQYLREVEQMMDAT